MKETKKSRKEEIIDYKRTIEKALVSVCIPVIGEGDKLSSARTLTICKLMFAYALLTEEEKEFDK